MRMGAVKRSAAVILCSVAVLLLKRSSKKKTRNRLVWTGPLCQARESEGCMTVTVPKLNHFSRGPGSFINFFRMDSQLFDLLVQKVAPRISRCHTKLRSPISVKDRVAVTLRYLATGNSMTDLHYSFRIGVSTISQIIHETTKAIHDALQPEYLVLPEKKEQWLEIAADYHQLWQFPNCFGSLDGKHILLQKPHHAGSKYHNYKGQESIVLMALVDAHRRFVYVDIGANGRVSDGGVWRNCALAQTLSSNDLNLPDLPLPNTSITAPMVIVADEAFPLKSYLMKPYPRRQLDHGARIFNYRLSRARRIVENAFGQLAAVWRIYRRPINVEPDKVDNIVLASCVLQNYLLTHRNIQYTSDSDAYVYDGSWRQVSRDGMRTLNRNQGSNFSGSQPKGIRDSFKNYFLSASGAVEWQERAIALPTASEESDED